jgi:hypothetical protein
LGEEAALPGEDHRRADVAARSPGRARDSVFPSFCGSSRTFFFPFSFLSCACVRFYCWMA